MSYLLVHSRSSHNDAKYLSTFTPCNIEYNGRLYPSIENAFQAAKLQFITTFTDVSHIYNKFVNVSPATAKYLGNKSSFNKFGITLDTLKWNTNSTRIMKTLIQLRKNIDPLFTNIINSVDYIYHYERGGKNSYWGGHFDKKTLEFVGHNMYGKLLKQY